MGKLVRSLLWKEWREQRWKLAFGSVTLAAFTGVGLQARLVPDEYIVLLTSFVGGWLLPVFVAMGLVAAERGEGSLHTLLALPARPWVVLAVKLLVGAAACLAPLAASAGIACLLVGGREMHVPVIVARHAASAMIAMCVLVWTVSLSIRQPTEARAGLMGAAIVLVIVLGIPGSGRTERLYFVDYLNPGLVMRLMDSLQLGTYLLTQIALAAFLFWLALLRLPRHVSSRI